VAVSFIGGGSSSTRRKPQPAASHWQTLLHNAVKQVHSPWAGFELTMLIGTDFAYVVVNPTSIQSRRPLKAYVLFINLCTIIMCIKYFCHDFFGYMWEGGVDFILWKCPRYFQVLCKDDYVWIVHANSHQITFLIFHKKKKCFEDVEKNDCRRTAVTVFFVFLLFYNFYIR
jgi:hypothetical protein